MDKLTEITSLFRAGRIGRRELMQGAAALGLTAAAATSLVPTAEAATPKRGGHAKAGILGGETTDDLDIATINNEHQMFTILAINEYLTETDSDGALQPRLATRWEPSDGGKTWVFKLRKDVEHSNGKTVDSADVVTSFRHHVREGTKSSFKPQVEAIEEIRADGPDTVIFVLESANADFPTLTTDYRAAILPSKDGEPLVLDGSIGAGSYTLKEYEPGFRAVIERNPNHWKTDVGFFGSVELLAITDDTARQAALVSGSIDAMHRCNLATAKRLAATEGINVLSVKGKQHYAYPMRTDTAPFDDNNVRLALKHAIDREDYLQKIVGGFGSLGNDHPISAAYRHFNADIPQRTYDPDKAKHYLKKAGLDSLSIEMHVNDAGFPGAVDGAILFAEHARKAGIDIKVNEVPADGYWSETWMKKAFTACSWYGRPVEDEVLTTTYAHGAAWNDTFFEHERFNELLVQARGELDVKKRAEMYGEVQRILHEEGGQLVPAFVDWVDAVSTKIGTPEKVSSARSMDGGRFAERWWFKA